MSKIQNLLSFKLAELSKGKEWFIHYYVINPATGKLHRKKIKLNWIKSIPERKKYADLLRKEINQKLYNNWNPFIEEMNPRGYIKMSEVFKIFIASKERELRPESLRSYRSFETILNEWLKISNKENINCEFFSKIDAVEFMEWAYNFRKLSSTTYNNYRIFYISFWNWMKSHQYVSQNHFEKLAKKTYSNKIRVVIESEVREKIKNHLEAEDYNFLIVCFLIFHSLIRPKEIAGLKPSNFDLKNQVINIPSHVSKNKHDRVSTIPDILMTYLENWDFNKANPNDYIFSEKLVPGKKQCDPRAFSRKWEYLRKELNLDEKMKLYSLRDSGIIQKLRDGISPEEVMKQADHSSLEITTIYVKFANPTGSEQIKRKSSKF
jgi:integrase